MSECYELQRGQHSTSKKTAITFPCESSSQSSTHPNCSSTAASTLAPEARGSHICRWPLSDEPLLGLQGRSIDGPVERPEHDPVGTFHFVLTDFTVRCVLPWNATLLEGRQQPRLSSNGVLMLTTPWHCVSPVGQKTILRTEDALYLYRSSRGFPRIELIIIGPGFGAPGFAVRFTPRM